jgi:nucleoside-diphosphate-sugar epimerase
MKLAAACQRSGTVLVHFSTDYAFGGYSKSAPYEETDRPAPLNVYGVSKVAGEDLIAYNTDRYFVVRVCGLYGVAGSSGKACKSLDCRQAGIPGNPFEFFLQRGKVALNDGAEFGKGGEGFVRLNFACPRSTLTEAMKRMSEAFRMW